MAERSPRERILRISSNRMLEVLDGLRKPFRCALIGKPATLEISLVSLRNHARCASETNLLFRREFDAYLRCDRASQFVAQAQHILQITLVTLCPKVMIRGSLNQLSR